LTAEADFETLMKRHVADSLALVPVLRSALSAGSAEAALADVGSGGGLIGFPIKIAWPQAKVTLIEPVQRKFDFLNYAAVQLGLPGLRILKESAENLAKGSGRSAFDAAFARALAPLEVSVRLCLPLVRSGGACLIYQSQPAELEPKLRGELARGSARLVESVPYRLLGEKKERFIAVFKKEEK